MSRRKPNYLPSIASVALVLLMLGFFALTALHIHRLVTFFKEKVDVWLELSDNINDDELKRVIAEVRNQDFVIKESVTFISREQAAASMREDLGDDSMIKDLPNMMRDVVRFNVRADYLSADSLLGWREQLQRDTAVAELYIEAASTGNVHKNLENLGMIALVLGIMLVFAAIAIIHNTIRLALYSNRFVIKNQELVGASWGFISRPYIRRGIVNGLISALIAIAILIGLLWWVFEIMPDLRDLRDLNGILAVFIGLIITGVLISGLSSYFVVNKFLKMRLDDLY